ncbi:MucR family transcriptional regulator [Novosphingobium sp. YAF33]|uniref:MucR family transcriptional regulator n=1 Tax=Novosphingobium sp. YAF33 TaxID=3233082 RepID=UPI003F9BBA7D
MVNETLLVLTTDIVCAHARRNKIASEKLPELIAAVYKTLASLGKDPKPSAQGFTPAVAIQASIKPDAIACLECGKKFKTLRRHLGAEHQLSPDEYRRRWNLRSDYPLVAPNYAKTRKELAIQSGLGSRQGKGVKQQDAKLAAVAARDVEPLDEARIATMREGPDRKKLGIAAGKFSENDDEAPGE